MEKLQSPLKIALTALLLLNLQCAIKSIAPGDTMEINMDFDWSSADMRHGWDMFTPPQLTYAGETDQDSIKKGGVLYKKHCQKCHGPTGVGNGPLAKELNIQPADLQTITNDITNTYLVVQINNGKGNMPRWQDILTKQQSFDLTNYIRTLRKKNKK
ncbi:MAG: cytochrome c [Pseudomonadota bacterium]